MKKIAVINDLSGFGKCSLTAAIPVISVMGVQACPLPTAVLSAQTGFDDYYCDDYTEKMEYFRQEWEKMSVSFDGIYTGFMGNEAQVKQVFRFLDTFYKVGAFLLVDPIMGDEGVRFSFCTEVMLRDMKELVSRADVVTPNLMELCLLTDVEYGKVLEEIRKREISEEKPCMDAIKTEEQNKKAGLNNGVVKVSAGQDSIKDVIGKLAAVLLAQGVKTVIVTGIRFFDEEEKMMKIGNLTVTNERAELSSYPYIGGSFSGTGDLFASVVAGGIARGDDVFRAVELAGAFVGAAMEDSAKEKVPRNEGANFEKYLKMLL